MTVEELMLQGFDRETAEALARGSVYGGGGTPFPIVKINYDNDDILAEHANVKKGALVYGWKVNMTTLTVEEEGGVITATEDAPINMIILASVYQVSKFDNSTKKVVHSTNMFRDPFSSKRQIDTFTGKTVEQLRKEGVQLKFNNIWLTLIESGSGEWTPYIYYMHGVNMFKWGEQLKERGIAQKDMNLFKKYQVYTKKIPTNQKPAWVFIIKDIEDSIKLVTQDDMKELIKDAIHKFDEWVDSSNTNSAPIPELPKNETTEVGSTYDDVDIEMDEEIPF